MTAGWDPANVDDMLCRHEEAVCLALRHTGAARKAALHAHAMVCALEGGELVLPPAPGVPDHSRPADIPMVMPQKQYSTLGQAAKGPSPPVAWKLNQPRTVSKKEKRLGRKVAAEAEALREWLRLQKVRLGKLQGRAETRERLRHLTARLAKLQDALEEWDLNNPPEILSSPSKRKGKRAHAGGEVLSQEGVKKTVTRYTKEKKEIMATGELIMSDEEEDAKIDACVQADIAEQMETVKQIEELVPRAEKSLKDFEAAMGLTRVRAPGRGVVSMTPRDEKAARPLPVPKRKRAAASSSAGKGAKKAKPLPKTAIAAGPKKVIKGSSGKGKKAQPAVQPPVDDDFESASEGDVEMVDAEPSRRDRELWGGDELVYLAGRFFPKQYVMNEGDMPLPVWIAKEEAGEIEAEYVVDAILAEQGEGTERTFLVKWQGYELHPTQWLPFAFFKDCKALDVWEDRMAASGSS